jgi:hypothetical protein
MNKPQNTGKQEPPNGCSGYFHRALLSLAGVLRAFRIFEIPSFLHSEKLPIIYANIRV